MVAPAYLNNLLPLARVGASYFRNDLNILNGLNVLNSGAMRRTAARWKTFFDCDK